MKLKITRTQRSGGLTGGKVIFHIDAIVEVSPEEKGLIRKYKIGKQIVYSSETFNRLASGAEIAGGVSKELTQVLPGRSLIQAAKSAGLGIAARFALTVSIDDLIAGKAVECKDLIEMTDAEEAIVTGAQNLKNFLENAQTFDGREVIIEL